MKVIIHTNGREEDVEEEEGVGEEEEGEGVEEEEEGVGEEREGVGGSCARRFLRTNCGAGDEDTRERILSVKDHCGIWSQLCDHDHPSYTLCVTQPSCSHSPHRG